jgi:hypothetical protein
VNAVAPLFGTLRPWRSQEKQSMLAFRDLSHGRKTMRRLTLVGLMLPMTMAVTSLVAPPALAATEQLRLAFDLPPSGQSEPGPWTTGCFADSAAAADDGCVAVGGAGALSRVTRPSGGGTSPAIKFPDSGGGTAILQANHAAQLNPGAADLTITALVKLTAAETSPGANIVQKGNFGTAGGQWKLQIDNGVPSCRIAGVRNGAAVSALAEWGTSIAGTGWKFVECKRRGAVLSINVAGGTPVNAPEDATMEIANTAKVSIGAKGTGSNNDQFHGSLDNIVFSVG